MSVVRDRMDPGDDRGVTVTEMAVAAFILAMSVLAAVTMLGGAATTSAVGANRQTAMRVASSEIEQLRSLRHESLAIPASAPDFATRFEGRPTVTAPAGVVEPTSTVLRNGLSIEVRRSITWVEVVTADGRRPDAYKRATVVVTWRDTVGPHQLRLDAALFDPNDAVPT